MSLLALVYLGVLQTIWNCCNLDIFFRPHNSLSAGMQHMPVIPALRGVEAGGQSTWAQPEGDLERPCLRTKIKIKIKIKSWGYRSVQRPWGQSSVLQKQKREESLILWSRAPVTKGFASLWPCEVPWGLAGRPSWMHPSIFLFASGAGDGTQPFWYGTHRLYHWLTWVSTFNILWLGCPGWPWTFLRDAE